MKVTTETVAPREVKLTIEPDADKLLKARRAAARSISQYRPIAGYRPGKAPLEMVERIFGVDVVLDEALNTISESLYRDAVKEAELDPYEPGQFEIESRDPLVVTLNVSLMPTIDLGDYKSLHVDPQPEPAVTDEQVDEEIQELREQNLEYEPVERIATIGDQVVLDMRGEIDGETVVEETGTEMLVNADVEPIGLAEVLVGKAAGETSTAVLSYSDGFENQELAGKSITMTITVQTVREPKLPEVDDEFAKDVSEYETLDELKNSISERLLAQAQAEANATERRAVITALVENATIEYPVAAVDHELDAAINRQKSQIAQMGLEWQAYLRMIGTDEQALRDQNREDAEERLKDSLVLSEFSRAEEITVSPNEIEEQLNLYAAMYGSADQADEIKRQLIANGAIWSIESDLRTQRALDHLLALLTGRELETELEAEEPAPEETVSEESTEDSETE